ncbi:hypothetical protein [Streptomyces sp. NPDC048442]|uniref:hypothetical protein n=1 Tax=Streptomyces sp. NPDC048442 TaxID=3154823 RepID=UPI0034251C24
MALIALVAFPALAILAALGVVATHPQGRLRYALHGMAAVAGFTLGTIISVLLWSHT